MNRKKIMQILTRTQGAYTLSTDSQKLDINTIHHFLAHDSYWARHIPRETVERAIKNSLNFGVYHGNSQVGYARIISDYATIAYLGDVFILPEHRGQALSKWLMESIKSHPQLQGLRRWILLTADAHELYKAYGWTALATPDRWMECHNPKVYQG
ncbi:GNAT family N-acetyltransferase [Cytophagales bacterium LB-30]|uniref:GNAT family N-acetyltransferase n=2 Tax=Shiella aurantiaca TaxID=3058365 RepID=A0ABT8F5W7_9BACT|nr:GNAT family N-acetyltransferase [Shiella aurantiaca]